LRNYLIITFLLGFMACTSKPGDRIPSFEFKDLTGKTVSSKMLEGKATVICVWATWCSDCIREIPELNSLVDKYKDNPNVTFIAFSDEDEHKVQTSLKRFPFNFTHLVNTKAYSDKLKSSLTKHFPQVLVINEDLEIVFEVTENKAPIFSVLDSHIQTILNEL
jgi:peroxiredoxin